MARYISRRSAAIAAIAIVLLVVAAAVAAPTTLARVKGWFSSPSSAANHSRGASARRVPADHPTTNASVQATGPASVQLVSQDLTPSAQLHLTASGFLPKERLAVTVEDPQGNTYEQVTLVAGTDGRLRAASVAPPPQLASGTYEVRVVGDTSHRAASATFQMHDIPPTVALDTYTATPGQTVGFVGHGFIAGEQVMVYLGKATAPLVYVKAAADGTASGHLTVPGLAAGNYTLTMLGSVSQTPISVGFSIQGYGPWVVLNRYALVAGQGLGFIGQGFAPNEPVLVYLNGAMATPALNLTADSSGRIVQQDSWIPSAVSGSNTLTFVGQQSKTTTEAAFTVLPAAQPTPTTAAP